MTYQLTIKAEADIDIIYENSILDFGWNVASDYIDGLHRCFEMLNEYQSWGNDYGFITSNLKRYEYRSHSVYYQGKGSDILIVRVLGNRQDPARHVN